MNDACADRTLEGAGLGLRRSMLDELRTRPPREVDFFEVAPENWIRVGGLLKDRLRYFTDHYPFVTHGLSLSLGGPHPLDEGLVRDIKTFLAEHRVRRYSEHLSYCADDGHLYDLMPIPFTAEAVSYVAERIRRVQDILEQRIAIENVSYYAAPGREMDEATFVTAVLEEADCDLLLDVNNIYVNSINHDYDADAFLARMPAERIAYLHVAGHYVEAEDLRVDTHGADVCDPVWALLERAYARFGPLPTLLERDCNIPPIPVLLAEVAQIRSLQTPYRSARPQVVARG
jgi:uncharacterized protein (UPF0276 family)